MMASADDEAELADAAEVGEHQDEERRRRRQRAHHDAGAGEPDRALEGLGRRDARAHLLPDPIEDVDAVVDADARHDRDEHHREDVQVPERQR